MQQNLVSCTISLVIFYALFFLVQMGLVKDPVFLESSFSPGDFQEVSLFNNTRSPAEDNPENTVQGEQNIASADNEHAGLFSCPFEGCVSTFQRHCNLERHMHYGKCKFVEERHSFSTRKRFFTLKNYRKDQAYSHLLAVLSFPSKVFRSYCRAGHCDLRMRLPVSVLSRKPT